MDVTLAANRLFAESSFCVHHNAEEKHFFAEHADVFLPADVHGDVVDGVRPFAGGIQKTFPNVVELACLRHRTKHTGSVIKIYSRRRKSNVESSCRIGARNKVTLPLKRVHCFHPLATV